MKKIEKVGVTETVKYIVEKYAESVGVEASRLFERLAEAVTSIKKGNYDIDTSDNSISFNRIPLSFIRDWKKGEAIILTNGEAKALDPGERIITFTKK